MMTKQGRLWHFWLCDSLLMPVSVAAIARNIAYGKEGSSLEAIMQAAKDANAHDFIMSFPGTTPYQAHTYH